MRGEYYTLGNGILAAYKHQDAHNNHIFPHDHVWDILGKKILPDGRIKYIVYRHKENLDPDYIHYSSDEEE